MDAREPYEGAGGDAEMPSDDVEIRDEPRVAEETDDGERADEDWGAGSTPGEVREPFSDVRDDDLIEVGEGDTDPPREDNIEASEPNVAPAPGPHEAQELYGE